MSAIKITILSSGFVLLSSLSAYTYMYCQKKVKSRCFRHIPVTTSDLSKGDNVKYRKHIKTVVELIDKATRSVYITMYLFTIRDFCGALIRAQQRGVDVKIILDGTMMNCMGSQKGKLAEGGKSNKWYIVCDLCL